MVIMLKPKEIKERMKDDGPLYKLCKELLSFFYDEGIVKSKPDPKTFINNELYLRALNTERN